MKKLLCATVAAFLLCVSCSSVQVPEDSQPQDSIPVSVTQPASATQPAFITGQIIDLTDEPYSDDFSAVVNRVNSFRDKPKFGYLYVVDELGMPVQNIQCFSKAAWEKRLAHQDINSLDMVSLPSPMANSLLSGILPIDLRSKQISPTEDQLESLEVVLVNLDTDGEPICLELTLNLAELSEHQAITVVWEGAMPSISSRNSEWLIDVFVTKENSEPAVDYEVILSEYQDNWTAHSYFRHQSRYTDASGKATFVLNKMAPQTFLDNTEAAYMIDVLAAWSDGGSDAYKRSSFNNGVRANRLEVEFPRPDDEVFTMQMNNIQIYNEKSEKVETTQIDKNTLDEMITAISEVIVKYNNGTIVESDLIQPLPSDFVFPNDVNEENINVYYREVMGEYKITLSSLNNKWDAVFFANNFIYVDSDGNTSGGSFVVTDVIFIEKQN